MGELMRTILLVIVIGTAACVPPSVTHRPVGERSFVIEVIGDQGTAQGDALLKERAALVCGRRGYEILDREFESIGTGSRITVKVTCGAPPRPSGLEVVTALDGIEVAVVPSGSAAWTLAIRNARSTAVSVVWDESTYVASGETFGRLIRGETRKIDTAKQQPASPIAPNTMLREWVVPEKFAPMLEGDAVLKSELARGTLHLVFTSDAGKQTWTGSIVDAPTVEAEQ